MHIFSLNYPNSTYDWFRNCTIFKNLIYFGMIFVAKFGKGLYPLTNIENKSKECFLFVWVDEFSSMYEKC